LATSFGERFCIVRDVLLSLLAVLTTVTGGSCYGAAGEVDTTFGVNGIVLVSLPSPWVSSAVVRRSGGRIVYVGTVMKPANLGGLHDCVSGLLAGFNADGSADPSFGRGGVVASGEILAKPVDMLAGRCLRTAIVQRDDKVVVFGTGRDTTTGTDTSFALRLTARGDVDPTFGASGYSPIETGDEWPWAAALQNDGKTIVTLVASQPRLTLLRLNADGSRDTSFGSNGRAVVPLAGSFGLAGQPTAVALQRDGKIVVAASWVEASMGSLIEAIRLARLLPDGSLDPSFGVGGIAGGDLREQYVGVPSLAIQADGRIVVATSLGTRETFGLARYRADGSLDTTFGTGGLVTTAFPGYDQAAVTDLEVTPSGKLVVAGYAARPSNAEGVVARYLGDGSLDAAFGAARDGRAAVRGSLGFQSMSLSSDGSLVFASLVNGLMRLDKLKGDDALDVVEFYNASLDHYFMSADVQEVTDLDFGFHRGWTRTGLGFKAYSTNLGNAAVAGILIPPALGDSHFFTSDEEELAEILAKMVSDPNYQGYIVESPIVFRVVRPGASTGQCPPATEPVYRLWNQRLDSNHRYTASLAVRAEMISRGYVSEGAGSSGVAMCAPLG
jgi:uncharacterized delta-60 repeat protein